MQVQSASPAIGQVRGGKLEPGALWKQFASGCKAVCLQEDPRVAELWDRVVHNRPEEPSGSSGWKEFWNNGVLTFARNHVRGKTDYGDLFWFEPEAYGYIARKMVIYPDTGTGELKTYPSTLLNDGGEVAALAPETLQLAWSLALDVLKSSLPREDVDPGEFVVHLELLKYPDSYQDLERVHGLVNWGSAWKKMGIRLDHARVRARGPFARRFVRDGYAWGSLLPWIGESLRNANRLFGSTDFHRIEPGYAPVGEAHVDGCRFLTLLASDRDVMKTEAYCDGRWEELPMSPGSLTIFPGTAFDPEERVKPTIHRYSIRKETPKTRPRKLNLTLLLGISTRKRFEEHRPS